MTPAELLASAPAEAFQEVCTGASNTVRTVMLLISPQPLTVLLLLAVALHGVAKALGVPLTELVELLTAIRQRGVEPPANVCAHHSVRQHAPVNVIVRALPGAKAD
jgi:hypothetical protein